MKLLFIQSYLTAILCFLSLIISYPLKATTFEQQEVNQSEFIAIARPYGENKFDLLVLQQVPGQRQCWLEQGENPILVNPLLLNFDFTGSCERSTDSNGYSIRIDGQDYGLNYLMRIVERNGELVLVGTPRDDRTQPEIIIGRTQGLARGFLKIQLDPGWRFTKRIYQGQIIGHVYLTGDSSAIRPPASSNPVTSLENNPNSTSNNHSGEPVRELTFTSSGTPVNSQKPPTPPTSSHSSGLPLPPDPATSSNSPHSSGLPLPPSPATSSTSSHSSGLPLPPTAVSSSPSEFSDLPPLPVPRQVNQSTIVPPPDPSGRQSLSQVMNNLSTPQGGTVSNVSGYRVLVSASGNSQQKQVKTLYPDAFPTSYKGRSLWQIGLFSTRENAEKALLDLENQGINGLIIP